jgi:hypothetical protein
MSTAKSPNAPKKSLLSSAMLDELTDPAIPDDVRADLTPDGQDVPQPAEASAPKPALAAKPAKKSKKGGAKDDDAEFAEILETPVQVSAAADVPSTKTVSLRLDSKLARRVKMIAMMNEFEGRDHNTMTDIMEDALRKWCLDYYRQQAPRAAAA